MKSKIILLLIILSIFVSCDYFKNDEEICYESTKVSLNSTEKIKYSATQDSLNFSITINNNGNRTINGFYVTFYGTNSNITKTKRISFDNNPLKKNESKKFNAYFENVDTNKFLKEIDNIMQIKMIPFYNRIFGKDIICEKYLIQQWNVPKIN